MKTIHNLETLKTFVQSVTNKDFNIDTGSQSFNVYPTEHVEICFCDHSASIEVGTMVYHNLSINESIIEHLEKLIPLVCNKSDEIGDYVILNNCYDNTHNVSFGGVEYDVKTFNFDSVVDVMTKIELFDFE